MSHICIFARTFYPTTGGLERIALILATQFCELGHRVEVVTDTIASLDEDHSFPFRITRTTRFRDRLTAFRAAGAVLFMNVSLHGIPPALLARRAVVFSHHGFYGGQGVRGRILAAVKRCATRFCRNVSVSNYVAQHIPASSAVIPNAYDSDLFVTSGALGRERDFVVCARLVSEKGVEIAVRAFAEVCRVIPSATMTVVGDGPERRALENLARLTGVSSNVRFTGALYGPVLSHELQRHACALVPSLVEEGFGIAALEGIASCDCIIASSRGGLPEATGRCGTVVEPTVRTFASAMTAVARARQQNERLPGQPTGGVRRAHLALHQPERVARMYLEVIHEALGPARSNGSC